MRRCNMMLSLTLLALIGCQAPGGMDMGAMTQPPRAPEMDYLAPLVGKWRADVQMKMGNSDETVQSSGTNEITWGLGGRYLIEHMTADMGEGQKMNGMGVWTWDPKAKCFRTWWFDDWGGYGHGKATYCPNCRTFCFKGTSHNLAMGMKTVGEGCARLADDNTMEWSWKERIPWTPITIMEMTGTSTRQ